MARTAPADVHVIAHADLGRLRAGDFPGTIGDPRARRRYVQANSEGSELAKHREHGGVAGYLDHLKAQIAAAGVVIEPIILAEHGGAALVWDGHTRALAAFELGFDVPARPAPLEQLNGADVE